ncbi:Lsr2 family protein [Streptomyces rimosus]|uniref:histone-like nucleoid-structuring protein Lsr2 n=1 Tax=Streptomyces rimosus TaxID=1927 RepID=UPI0004C6CE65|nr:Lsr2 family protein [Streptomyces rimosus]
MAQKVQILLVDDLNGGKADETVTFGLDGKSYEIDLSKKHAAKLREALAEFVKAGRKTGGRAVRGTAGTSKATSSSASKNGGSSDTAKIRAWAKENGYNVNDRGRVPAEIREAYGKASA